MNISKPKNTTRIFDIFTVDTRSERMKFLFTLLSVSLPKKSTTWHKYPIPLAIVLDQISYHGIAWPIALSALNCQMRVIFYHPSPIIFSFALSVQLGTRLCSPFFSEGDWTHARSHNGVCLPFDC